jgi:hypothetical protein
MGLPKAHSATLDLRKLTHYCLSDDHPLGRHKARVFKAALGIVAADAGWLRNEILRGILDAPAVEIENDRFGSRYRVDLQLKRQDREAVVRTIWLATAPDGRPRFITCWIV